MLLFPSQSILAGRQGLLLWFNIIIPTLFPFMILSYIIIHSPLIDWISRLFSPLFKKLLGVSGVASYALIMGCLSGYPMGAFIVADLFQTKRITKGEANYLLTFCNNVSPMFVLGFVATSLLNEPKRGIPILLTIYLGNCLTALFFRNFYSFSLLSKAPSKQGEMSSISFSYLDDCIARTAEVLVKVGGYIIIFSLPVLFLSALPIHNLPFKFLISTLDLSNGVNLLANANCSLALKSVLLSTLCAFGTFSVVGQTASVIKTAGLSIRKYLFAKLVNGVITFGCGIVIFLIL